AARLWTFVVTATPASTLWTRYRTRDPVGSALITRFCAVVIRDSWAFAADFAVALPDDACGVRNVLNVEAVSSLSRKAYLPLAGTPSGDLIRACGPSTFRPILVCAMPRAWAAL